MLCAVSLYFQKALNGDFKEAQQDSFAIPDFHVSTVLHFQEWLALRGFKEDGDDTEARAVHCYSCGKPQCEDGDPNTTNNEFTGLSVEQDDELEKIINGDSISSRARLYHFADRYDIPLLRLHLINEEWKYSMDGNYRGHGAMIYAWRNMSSQSPFIRLMTDNFAYRWRPKDDTVCLLELPMRQKLPNDLLFCLLAKASVRDSNVGCRSLWNEDMKGIKELCAYHEHEQSEAAIQSCKNAKAAKKRLRGMDDTDAE